MRRPVRMEARAFQAAVSRSFETSSSLSVRCATLPIKYMAAAVATAPASTTAGGSCSRPERTWWPTAPAET
eukprot:4345837-Pleurochrysis_carterae.AAC.2